MVVQKLCCRRVARTVAAKLKRHAGHKKLVFQKLLQIEEGECTSLDDGADLVTSSPALDYFVRKHAKDNHKNMADTFGLIK
jgi:hypothetical protein